MIYCEPGHLKFVQEQFRKCGFAKDVFVFGSRARGDQKKYSDLDIIIKASRPVDLDILSVLRVGLADSDLPYTVDISDWERISEPFRQSIIDELVPLF
jgi:uncharacterized protein